MRTLGFDVVRLLVHWSALEPRRGTFDTAYLDRIRQAVGWAREHGIYVVLDMHQDAWGKYIASPPGETCAPGFTHQQGWDGAPRWATLTGPSSSDSSGSWSGAVPSSCLKGSSSSGWISRCRA